MTDLAERRGVETEVYQPAEDSALLASVAEESVRGDDRVLEVGTGSGWVAERVRAETGASVVASDLNPHATRQARERGLEAVQGDLVSGFRDGAFDVVLFNPPYLPADAAAARDDWMERALSGGEDGRAVVEPFVEAVGRVLAPDGYVLVLVSSLTGVDEVVEFAGERGFSAVAMREESHPFETLSVLKLVPA
ncbi:HemK2/MTQ2 family protein methyltransferase [Halorubellus sp. PRR65]|uniref:HemK2/MTQ2 family protein methyltransferase n=1 Tax=Halorubellus sp. PRR65 TaxID=3098148 RepID=UPI002B25F1CD|nr:HemK2/MTQ2 family protein methyltransferase [Halorubellus sp. PRR65]